MAPSQDLLNSPVQIITQIFTQIIAHTPVWVWGFLAVLIAYGAWSAIKGFRAKLRG